MHNPRAEAARNEGCSYERFMALMKEDDELDAALTALGQSQARKVAECPQASRALNGVDLVVSSPLSRALHTADLALPPPPQNKKDSTLPHECDGEKQPNRICLEHFREINGLLLNGKRRAKSYLEATFGGSHRSHWSFSHVESEEDDTWTEELESEETCGERGYQGLLCITKREEEKVLVVAHGGLLKFMLVDHPNIKLLDRRSAEMNGRSIEQRFRNCELREFDMTWEEPCDEDDNGRTNKGVQYRPTITIAEVTDFVQTF
eukprot:CAMPEP_0195512472 /NCGR_PEP_ID=MMETSP0794_2-20130614/4417_1 /TAXON_ID=515487 /ORGANISM="Stephanopyxis turris, Strain CCMP 815" /LENGTH=262 /DNA_ID=CAMNT_0040640261 /DNA_START=100 /DNA_END=888 /DNA_ORIENTATION=-